MVHRFRFCKGGWIFSMKFSFLTCVIFAEPVQRILWNRVCDLEWGIIYLNVERKNLWGLFVLYLFADLVMCWKCEFMEQNVVFFIECKSRESLDQEYVVYLFFFTHIYHYILKLMASDYPLANEICCLLLICFANCVFVYVALHIDRKEISGVHQQLRGLPS